MGLLQAAKGSVSGVLADQWKEYFYCDSLDQDVLMKRGYKKTGSKSSNKGNDNIISNGSGIAVADGQCMLIVEQGKVVEVCAEPGAYTFDTSTEPSIFAGNLKDSIKDTFKTLLGRFTYGGDTGKDQRVYYINIKEIIDNKYGTASPVPFRVVDTNVGLDMDIAVRCNGVYSYKITNPILFYTNVCGNVADQYDRETLDAQMKSEFLTALQPAFAKISEMGVRYSAIAAHTQELADAMNAQLSAKWAEIRGIEVVSVGVNSITADEEDEKRIKDIQSAAVNRDPSMAAATLTTAQAEAMKDAANNEAGAFTGFMGMGFAQQAGGGTNAADLFDKAQQQKPADNAAPAAAASWTCECGTTNTGNFCQNCGKEKPAKAAAKFCQECGAKLDTENPPKFCPNCGKPIG